MQKEICNRQKDQVLSIQIIWLCVDNTVNLTSETWIQETNKESESSGNLIRRKDLHDKQDKKYMYEIKQDFFCRKKKNGDKRKILRTTFSWHFRTCKGSWRFQPQNSEVEPHSRKSMQLIWIENGKGTH